MYTWLIRSMGRVILSIHSLNFHISQRLPSGSVPWRYPNFGTRTVSSHIDERSRVYAKASQSYPRAQEALSRTLFEILAFGKRGRKRWSRTKAIRFRFFVRGREHGSCFEKVERLHSNAVKVSQKLGGTQDFSRNFCTQW